MRLNADEAVMAAAVARYRQSRSLGGGRSNLPKEWMTPKERVHQQYAAISGELVVARDLNLYWTGCGKQTVDVGGLVEVRSSFTPERHGLLVRARDRGNMPCVLVGLEHDPLEWRHEVTFLGWATYDEVRGCGRRLWADTKNPAWSLPASELRSRDELVAHLEATGAIRRWQVEAEA